MKSTPNVKQIQIRTSPGAEVGNEMGVHHIHVEVIHAVAFQLLDVALQIHQIGAHDRNRYFSFFGGLHGVFIMLAD